MHKNQTDIVVIVLKHVEGNFVPHITKEQIATRKRVKPIVKQNTASKPRPTPPSSPTVKGVNPGGMGDDVSPNVLTWGITRLLSPPPPCFDPQICFFVLEN